MLPTTIAFAILAALPGAAALSQEEALAFDQSIIAKANALNSNFRLLAVDNASTGFAPYKAECPANVTWVRPASTGLNDGETAYLKQRSSMIDEAVTTMMKNVGLPKPNRNPVIGISMSGGGYRAMINTLGQAQGLMKGSNGTGGWMDAVSYMAGLSGGSWATGAFVANGGAKPTDQNADIWDMSISLLGPSNNSEYLSRIASLVAPKAELGFPVQITDIWGLAIGQHVLPRAYRIDTNPNMTISGLASTVPEYANASLPMPIIIAASIDSPLTKVESGSPIYEYTPYEFGTWDASNTTEGGYFTPVEWLGSDPKNNTCYKGYDQMSFIVGVSATLFNAIGIPVSAMFPNSTFTFLNSSTENVATVPNPFEGYNGTENPDPTDNDLTLVDAGETNQNLPLLPLLVPARKVDAIIALDASSDTNVWPDGSALYNTYKEYENNTEFHMPKVPSPAGFINGGLNTRPTFFGCNDTQGPLVVYIPNYPYSALTNISTLTLSQSTNLTNDQLESTLKTVTLDGAVAAWPTCLACALTDRANNYSAAARPADCAKCFDAFCWNGEDNSTKPEPYYPTIGIPPYLKSLNLTVTGSNSSNNGSSSGNKDSPASAVSVGKAFVLSALGVAAWVAL